MQKMENGPEGDAKPSSVSSPEEKGVIQVGVVDQDTLLREGLAALLNTAEGLSCAGHWGDLEEAMTDLQADPPDVLLLDMFQMQHSGFHALRHLLTACPSVRTIVMVKCQEDRCVILNRPAPLSRQTPLPALTLESTLDDCLQVALKMGAQGAIRKQCAFRYIEEAIHAVYAGCFWIEPGTSSRLAQQHLRAANPVSREAAVGPDSLTHRERQIIHLIAQGLSNKEIAHELHLGYSTIKNYVSSILGKLSLHDRTQIALYAVKQSNDSLPLS
jgi:DNA-binding NarL/FixJ family response regulator